MSVALIRRALESRLKTWADAKPLPVAWPNLAFDPPTTTYLRAYLLPAQTTSDTLDGLHRQYRGVFQVSIVLPRDVGPGSADLLVAELDAQFPVSTPLTAGGVTVYIINPMSAAPAIVDDGGRYIAPVSATYRAHTI